MDATNVIFLEHHFVKEYAILDIEPIYQQGIFIDQKLEVQDWEFCLKMTII